MRSRRAGVTLIEVVIAGAVFTIMGIALVTMTIPITRSSSDTTVALDMDQRARSFFGSLRADLRTSGFGKPNAADAANGGGVFCFPLGGDTSKGAMYLLEDTDGDTLNDKLTFRKRKGPLDTDWGNKIIITRELIGGRTSICREVKTTNNTVVTAKVVLQSGDIANLQFVDGVAGVAGVGQGIIEVTLSLTRTNPNQGLGPGEPVNLLRDYVDRVQLMNKQ